MSGIVGIISKQPPTPVSEADLAGLADAYECLRAPGASRDQLSAGDRARVVRIGGHAGETPIVREGSSWAVSAGVVHHTGHLLTTPVTDLEGQFALVTYDAEADEVRVAVDPFGMQAVYVADRGGRTYISTSALALAKHLAASPSRLGMHCFLLSGYQFGTTTAWEGIRRLDPATLLRFTRKGVQEVNYWRPTLDPSVRRLSLQECVHHCIEVAVETFRARFGGGQTAWADLTGGFDSRLLMLLLREAGTRLDANTRDTPTGEDEEIAARLVATTGLPWARLSYPPTWPEMLPARLPVSLAWADGNLEVLQLSRVLWAHEQLAKTNARLLSGGGGEHFQYYPYQTEFLRAGRSTKVSFDNWVTMRLLPPVDTSIFAGDPTPEVRADFRDRMMHWAEPFSDELNTTQLDVLYAYKSTGHFGAYRSADAAFLSAELPFYFKPVFAAALSASHKHRNGHRLMRHMIERLDPATAAIATTKGGPGAPWRLGNSYRFAPYFSKIGRKAVTKVATRYLGKPLLAPSGSFPWINAANAGVLDALGGEGVLDPLAMRSGGLYEPQALARFFARARERDFTGTDLLGRIITVELALRSAGAEVGG